MARNVVEIILQGVDKASGVTGRVTGAISGIGRVAAQVGAAVSAGLVAGTGAAVALAQNVARAGDEIEKMSRRTGLSAEFLSTMGFAAEQSGSSLQEFENGVKRLARNISDANEGLTTSERAFQKLGVEIKTPSGRLKEVEEILPEVSDALRGMKTDTERAATAQELFGRAGTQLLPLLLEGADGISALQTQARELGREYSTVAAKQSAEFVDAQNRLKSTLSGLKREVGEGIIPVLSDAADRVTAWVSANRELIAQDVTEFFERVIGVTGTVVENLGKVLSLTERVIHLNSERGQYEERLGRIALEKVKLQEEENSLREHLNALQEEELTGAAKVVGNILTGLGFVEDEEDVRRKLAEIEERRRDLAVEETGLYALLNEESVRRKENEEDVNEVLEERREGMREEVEELLPSYAEQEALLAEAREQASKKALERIEERARAEVGAIDTTIEKTDEATDHSLTSAQRVARAYGLAFAEVGTAIEDTFARTLTDAVLDWEFSGKRAMSRFADHARRELTRILAHKFFSTFASAIGGPIGAVASFIGGLFSTGGTVKKYQTGGIVGGDGTGDRVPALLSPGETVIPKRMTDHLLLRDRGPRELVIKLDGRDLLSAAGRLKTGRFVERTRGEYTRSR